MSKRALIQFFSLLLLVILPAFECGIAAADAGSPANLGAKRGWWWYEKEPVKAKNKKVKEKTTAAPVPTLKDYAMKQLWNMPTPQLRALLNAFLDKAVQYPTEQNVKNYYVVLDIVRRKALSFANTAAYVWQKYPGLSTAKDYPVAAPGRNAMARQEFSEVESTIEAARDDFALLYFYSPT